MTRFIVVLMVLCVLAAPAIAADAKLEKGIALPDGLPEAVKAQLAPTGFRVTNEAGAPYAELWFTNALPGDGKAPNGDVGYPGLADGTFLGVWRYVGSGSDYRGQPVGPGLYSMRYALMPADANHLGAFPYRDFVLLLPLSADQTPGDIIKWDEAVALSKKTANTNHPAAYPMAPAEGGGGDGVLVKDEQGHYLLKALANKKSGGTLLIGVVVIGHGE